MDLELLCRLAFVVLLLVSLAISGHYRRRARLVHPIERSRESGAMQLARVVVTLPLLVAIFATAASPERMQWAQLGLPLVFRYLGLGLAALIPLFLIWTFRSIGTNVSETVLVKTEHELVTHGPYRFIRHPIYSGGLLIIFTLGLLAASWLFLLLTLVAAAFIRLSIVPREETFLTEEFGERYQHYRDRTGTLLPKLF